jgi:hypothetical protein
VLSPRGEAPRARIAHGPLRYTVRTFVDPADSSHVAQVVEGATVEDFQTLLKSEATADAMGHDGVRVDTVRVPRNAEHAPTGLA